MTDKLRFVAAAPFEAARQLGGSTGDSQWQRLHGHSFTATIHAALAPGWAAFPGDELDALHAQLARAVAPLDYRLANEVIAEPSDENLARWIRDELAIPGLDAVVVRSGALQGAALNSGRDASIWRRYTLEAAHRLPHVRAGHKCGRMHGHGFQIVLHAWRKPGSAPEGLNYNDLDTCWAPVHAQLDRSCLNDIPGLENPTSEILAVWLWQRLKPQLAELSRIVVYETAQCAALYDGRHCRIWKEMTLDSSVALRHAPPGDARRRIHGHTYTLRLHINAPLDALMGWAIDFADVSQRFAPIFQQIDHQPLHELPGLEQADAASLARWLRTETARVLPQVDRIDLYERRGCGVILAADTAPVEWV